MEDGIQKDKVWADREIPGKEDAKMVVSNAPRIDYSGNRVVRASNILHDGTKLKIRGDL